MGKVASSSIYYSLKKSYPGRVFHAHTFSKTHPHPEIRLLFRHYQLFGKIKIITLVREPVARNISAFFQNFEEFTKVPFEKSAWSINELHELFFKNYKHDVPLLWMDNNIKVNFGIDVFKEDFPNSGWKTYRKGPYDLIILRSDLPDQIKEETIKNFLGISEFKLSSENIGAEKEYASAYREFKNSIKSPELYLDRMYSSKYVQHFFPKEYIEDAKKKWR